MAYGLCGAHRTGKTTLARAVSTETGLPFVQTATSDVLKREGIDPSVPMSFSTRMRVQNLILDDAIERWDESANIFITDRTPVDMLTYTLADITGDVAMSDEEWEMVSEYSRRCFTAGHVYFDSYILIQPGIPVVADASGKATAALNRSYFKQYYR